MNSKVISAIAFKLFAIYVVVSIIMATPTVIGTVIAMKRQSTNFETSFFWPALIITLSVVVTFIVFKILWRLGNNTINNVSEINVTDNNFDTTALQKALFIFLGLYFSITAFVELPNIATSFWVRSQSQAGVLLIDYAWLFSIIAELIIGLSLIKKPNQWLHFIRNMGLNNKSL